MPVSSSLCFQTKNETVRVYVGEALVYTYGETPQKIFGHGVGAVWNIATLPDNSAGEKITVALSPIGGRTGLAPYRFLLGARDGVISALLTKSMPMLLASLLLAIIGFGALILALIEKLRRYERTAATYFFALFVLLAAVWMSADSGLFQFLLPNKGVSYLLFGCSFYLLITPLNLFIAVMDPKHGALFRALSIVNSLYALLRVALYIFGVMDFEKYLWLLHILMGICLVASNCALWFSRNREGRLKELELCWALTAFSVLEGASLIQFYVFDKLNQQRNGYSSGFYFGILAFVLIVAIGLLRKSRSIREQAFRSEFYEQRAYTDELTGLLNAKGFDDKCAEILAKPTAGRIFAVVDFDVNFFSQYNASNGLDAGDRMLKGIENGLRAFCDAGELCARQEADHFVCLLRGDSLESLLTRIRRADETARRHMSERLLLVSYGVTVVSDRSLKAAALRNQALVAKRTVKGNYEQNVAVYDSQLHEQQLREMELLAGFERSLQNREYFIYLQPKIDTRLNALGGAEALVRRRQPDGAILSAGSIIAVLESRGFVAKLDYYIFEEVCRLQKRCMDESRPLRPISSNFSRVHLYDPEFPGKLAVLADKYGVPHEVLEVELTESAFLVGKDTLASMISRLRETGFRVAIDDFGSGYSSLNMLKDVEVDVIKLDREFLSECKENRRALAVIEQTLRLSKELRIESVAEGVESAEQAEFLRGLVCDYIQGYFYSKPIPTEDFLRKYLSAKPAAALKKSLSSASV